MELVIVMIMVFVRGLNVHLAQNHLLLVFLIQMNASMAPAIGKILVVGEVLVVPIVMMMRCCELVGAQTIVDWSV
jgi:hypothetical protein